MNRHANAGYVVETKSGKKGYTKHSDPFLDGNKPVYLDDGTKLLCVPETLKWIGYKD